MRSVWVDDEICLPAASPNNHDRTVTISQKLRPVKFGDPITDLRRQWGEGPDRHGPALEDGGRSSGRWWRQPDEIPHQLHLFAR